MAGHAGMANTLTEDGRTAIPLLPQHDRFNSPPGVGIDGEGNLYVSEWLLGGHYTKIAVRH